jgi:hypothetical protein
MVSGAGSAVAMRRYFAGEQPGFDGAGGFGVDGGHSLSQSPLRTKSNARWFAAAGTLTMGTMRAALLLLLVTAALAREVSVTGEAAVYAPPDYAVLNLTVESQDHLLRRARLLVDTDVAAVKALARKHGVGDADITFDLLGIDNVRQGGFVLRKNARITVRDLNRIEDFLAELFETASVDLNSTEYRVNDLKKYRDQARDMATRAAEEKAGNSAQTLGLTLGKPVDASIETGGGVFVRHKGDWGQRTSAMQVMSNVGANSGGGGQGFTRVEVTARVNIRYELN